MSREGNVVQEKTPGWWLCKGRTDPCDNPLRYLIDENSPYPYVPPQVRVEGDPRERVSMDVTAEEARLLRTLRRMKSEDLRLARELCALGLEANVWAWRAIVSSAQDGAAAD